MLLGLFYVNLNNTQLFAQANYYVSSFVTAPRMARLSVRNLVEIQSECFARKLIQKETLAHYLD